MTPDVMLISQRLGLEQFGLYQSLARIRRTSLVTQQRGLYRPRLCLFDDALTRVCSSHQGNERGETSEEDPRDFGPGIQVGVRDGTWIGPGRDGVL